MLKIMKFTFFSLSLILLVGCSGNKYLSQPANPDFLNDGERSEWTGRFQMPKGENFAMGISNDENYLYIALSSLDRDFQRQLAMAGLTLWMDGRGGKHRTLGLKYEGKMTRSGGRQSMRDQKNTMDMSEREGRRSQMPILLNGDLDLIVLDKNGRKRLGPADLLATINSQEDGLFIEYQIPLALLPEDFDPADYLGVGLESELERPEAGDRMSGGKSGGHGGGGMSGGGQRGGGRGSGGGRSGGPGGSSMGSNDIDYWFKVQLSQ